MRKSRDEEGSAAELRRKVTLLARELAEARAQQGATADVLKVISRSTFDLDAVLTTLITSAIELCDASRGVIWLRRGEQLVLAAHVNYASEWISFAEANPITPAADAQTTSGIAAFTGEVVNVEDIFADPRFRSLAGHSLGNYRAGLAVPLKRDGKVVGVISLSRPDVRLFTERQMALVQTFADQAVIAIENARLFEEVQGRNRELSETLEQQVATSAILRVIAASPTDLQPVLNAVAESAAQLCDAQDASMMLRRADVLAVVAHHGAIPIDAEIPIVRERVSGCAVLDRTPIHVHDMAAADVEFPASRTIALRLGVRTLLTTPLLREGEAIGALMIRRTEVRPFSDRQVELLQTFADQAVIAIENARLFEEVQARNRELSETLEQQVATSAILRAIAASPTDIQPVLDAVTENAAQLCEAYDSTILLRRGEVLAVAAHRGAISIDFAELPLQRDVVTSRAVLDRASVHIHDLAAEKDEFPTGSALALRLGFRTVLSTPLLREGEAIGALMIRRAEVRPFSERQVDLLKTFADQAVIAIENVRLFEKLQARTAELGEALQQQTATADVLKVISRSAFDLQAVLDTLAESAARLCEADIVDFYRSVENSFQWAASFGPQAEADRDHTAITREPGRGSVSGRVLLERKTVHVPDFEADAEFTFVDVARQRGVRAILGVPLLREDALIGLLLVMRKIPGPFSAKQIELAETFADQAVIAIENVRLFEEVQARTRELTESLERQTAASEILRVIARSPTDVQPVFDTIASSVAQLCAARYCIVFGFDGELVHFVAEHGLPPEAIAGNRRVFPMPPGRGTAAARAILSRAVEQIPDVEADPDFAHASITRHAKVRSLIAVPMLKDDVPVGAIVVARPQIGLFPERQIDLLKTFADQAVIAIENVRLFDEVQARTTEVSEALQQQTATADVLKVISRSAFDLQPVLQALIDSAARLCGADMGAITMREGDNLSFKAGFGQSPELRAYEIAHPHPFTRGTFQGRAAVEKATIHVPDVLQDAEYERQEAATLGDFRASLAVPLRRGEDIIGVFGLARRTAGPFAPRQIELVQTFADQAVIAIENVRLFEEVRARTAELTLALEQQTASSEILRAISKSPTDALPVFETIVRNAVALCGSLFANVFRFDGELLHFVASNNAVPGYVDLLRAKYPMPPDASQVSGRVLLTKSVVWLEDALADPDYDKRFPAMGWRRMLGVPMLRENDPLGVIVVGWAEAGPVSKAQEELLKTFADQAVIAIENVRLFDEVQAKTRDLEESLTFQKATNDVLEVIGRSASNLEPVLDAIVNTAADLCRADMSAVWLLRDGLLHHAASSSRSDPVVVDHMQRNPILPADRTTAAGRVVLEGGTIHIPDISADKDYTYFSPLGRMPFSAALGVPLFHGGKVVGVIILLRKLADPFTDRQIELVETFADQAVIAIENVRLFEEVQARTAELGEALQQQTATADVLKVISRSAFDLQPVLDALAATATRVCEADKGAIMRREGEDYKFAANAGFSHDLVDYAQANPLKAGPGSATSRAAGGRTTVHLPDVLADPTYTASEFQRRGGYRTMLAVPLLREGAPIGVFLLTRTEVKPFTEKQIELVETFADQAVIAIENVRLFEEVQARTAELAESLDDLRTAQDRLVQTEKLASLGQLTAGIAHEIKNPLNFVNNFSSLSGELIDELREALANAPVNDKLRSEIAELTGMLKGNLEKVVQHGKRADSIVKNMLLHSRAGSGDHRPTDINAIVEESLNLAYHGARAEKQGFNITMEKSLDPAAGEIDLFPQEITRVLLNLISNGFYAATKRKAEAAGAFEPVLAAATRNLGDSVEIRIRDNGTGIPPEVEEKMFNPFFTTKPAGEGTGLGLSLSHDIIVKQHAGTIEVETEPGAFTEFRIVLPRGAASLGKSGGDA